ncbi:MAG: 30S ribosomal protein S12 methylthiotransferase RimO [Nitrospirae bacterium]|nr:30S ribosomal protein S12 methylthiotransferase RimO [Nitrospirota bacterium]MBF0535122.1 30S ribosomal protein S12 methylthiotransferase RimO [Nitrospirota bacterium]MBF0615328.1 30S ribosomal protein S12 methylthiotransferase RimO [Nitrospirota bacterium]
MSAPAALIVTLGCPKNKVDSENLESLLHKQGIQTVSSVKDASFVIINTCGFIESAKQESINEILSLTAEKASGKKILVFGCLAQRYKYELMAEIPEIDAIWGVGKEEEIAGYFKEILAKERLTKEKPRNISRLPYAYLKAAEGCNRKCSFCVIPSIRGGFRSFPTEEIVQKAKAQTEAGKKELIFVAQDLTSYGSDTGSSLSDLIRKVAALSGDFWIRLLYLYPASINDELIACVRDEEKVLKYFDIPFQHSEGRILKAMGRSGDSGQHLKLIEKIRSEIPDAVFRTTFIVGHPGETYRDFSALMSFVNEAQFDHVGVFSYSDEEGTRSFNMAKKVSEKTMKKRIDDIMMLQAKISYEKNLKLIGGTYPTLIDEAGEGILIGRLQRHAPEIDGNVIIELHGSEKVDTDILSNFINVTITDASEYDLMGKIHD